MKKEKVYRRLAEHLDRLPGGFPPSKTGADLRLLEGLFSLEEAMLAIHMTQARETAQVIAERANLPLSQVQRLLEEMAQKGLIFSLKVSDGSLRYQAVQFGLVRDMQVKRQTLELLDDLSAYWSSIEAKSQVETIPQMRTIPVGESIEHHRIVAEFAE